MKFGLVCLTVNIFYCIQTLLLRHYIFLSVNMGQMKANEKDKQVHWSKEVSYFLLKYYLNLDKNYALSARFKHKSRYMYSLPLHNMTRLPSLSVPGSTTYIPLK